MKKRILALLLTGLIAMSAVACKEPIENPNLTGGSNNTNATTAPIQGVVDLDGFTAVNETVYAVVDGLNLRAEPSSTAQVKYTVNFKTALNRIKVKADWSVVKYEGGEYYVMTQYLMTETFAACSEVMHVSDPKGANVRRYPTTVDSNIYKSLSQYAEVNVIGKTSQWCEVMIDGSAYYISANLLTSGATPKLEDLGDFEAKFAAGACNKTMFTTSAETNLRLYPSWENNYSPVKDTIPQGSEVTVIAIAKVNDKYGEWAKVRVHADFDDPNSSMVERYIRLSLLSESLVSNNDLDSLLNHYGFERFDKVLYVSTDVSEDSSLPIRIDPTYPTSGDVYANCISSTKWPKRLASLTVVAKGNFDGNGWYIVHYDGAYYFVGTAYLTPDSNGKPVLTLDAVLAKYPTLSACTVTNKAATQGGYIFNTPVLEGNKSADLEVGKSYKIVAQGTYQGFSVYVFEDENGSCWFVDQSKFN